MTGDTEHNMKRRPLRRKCALYAALASLCLLVAGVLLVDTYEIIEIPLVVVGFPSVLLLLALSSCSGDVFFWPDSVPDAAWAIFGAILIIPSVCFWAGAGWTVGYFIDKKRRQLQAESQPTPQPTSQPQR